MRVILSAFSAIVIIFLGSTFFASEAYAVLRGIDIMAQCSPYGNFTGAGSCDADEQLCINSDCSLDPNGYQFKTHKVTCTLNASLPAYYTQCGCPKPYTGTAYPGWTNDTHDTTWVQPYPYTCKHEYDIIGDSGGFTEATAERETLNTFICDIRDLDKGYDLGYICNSCNLASCWDCSSGSCAGPSNYINSQGNPSTSGQPRGYYYRTPYYSSTCNNACQAPPPSSTSPPGSTPTPTPAPTTPPLTCGCGYVTQPCCYGQQAADCAGGSRCIEGTCSDPTSGGTCQQGAIGGNNNCSCGDGFIDDDNDGIWDSNEHGAACCGGNYDPDPDDGSYPGSGCSEIPDFRDCIQGLVCSEPRGSYCVRFKINGTVFVDDNGNGLFDPPPSGNEVAYQGAKVDYWYGEPQDDPCGKRASTNWGTKCLGDDCFGSGNSSCRTGQCYGSGGYICTTTSFSTTFSPDIVRYSQSSGFYEFTPNNSYTSSYQKHIIRLVVPSGYSTTTPTIQSREVSSGQYADGRLPPINFGIRQYHVGGYVKNRNTQAGIAGVQVRVVNSSGNYQTATTDSTGLFTGLFKVSGFILPGESYAVRVVGNINIPPTAPTGYLSPARTAYFRSGWPFDHVGWSWNGTRDTYNILGPQGLTDYSYENQTAGTNDCAGLDGSYTDPGTGQIVSSGTSTFRCSFTYDPLPPPGAPDWNPPAQDCPGGSPRVTLSWTAPQFATSYQIWRYGNGNWMQIGTTTNLTFDDPTISPSGYSSPIPLGGTTYRYMIRAVNASGTADSNILDLTTNACTGTPWIQTQGGDVHSNTGINVKLP